MATTGTILSSHVDAGAATVTAPFGEALVELGERDGRVVGLSADLAKYTDIHLFARRFPERFFQVGMAEQNLIGVAAGLARTGFVPFAESRSSSLTVWRRNRNASWRVAVRRHPQSASRAPCLMVYRRFIFDS